MWTCTACSYAENIDARSRCALCDAIKPAGAKSTPAPSGPKWSCASCTLENAGNATSCIACGAAKPSSSKPPAAATPAPSAHQPSSRPAAASAAPAASSKSIDADIKYLEDMGYDRPQCVAAMREKGEKNAALNWLLEQDAIAAAKAKANKAATAAKPASTPATAAKPTTGTPATTAKPASTPSTISAAKPATATPTPAAGASSSNAPVAKNPAPFPTVVKPPVTNSAHVPTGNAAASAAKPATSTTATPTATKSATTAAAPAAKPATTTTPAAVKPAATSTTSKPTASTSSSANAVVAPLAKLSISEQKDFEVREAKRLALLKQLEEEALEKAAKKKAATATASFSSVAPPKKPAAATAAPTNPLASTSAPPKAASSFPSSSSSFSSVAPAAPTQPREDNLTPEERKLQQIADARAAEAEKRKFAALRITKRLEAEKSLRDIPSVCRTLANNYDTVRFEAIIGMLRRIIDKVVSDGGANEKFRRIPLSNAKLEQTLTRPIGPIWILKQVGFEERVEEPSAMQTDHEGDAAPDEEQRILYLPKAKVNIALLQKTSQTLQEQLVSRSSEIPAIFQQIVASKKYSTELIYHFALELKKIVQNIIVSTDEIDEVRRSEKEAKEDAMTDVSAASSSSSTSSSRRADHGVNKNFRTIDKHESFYINRIKPITESKRILAILGFELDAHDLNRQFLVVPFERLAAESGVKQYQIILRELIGIIASLRDSTAVAVGLRTLASQNRKKPMEKFVTLFIDALRKVVLVPHEQKLHKINLGKLQAKIGTEEKQQLKGMSEFVQLFDFKPVEGDARVVALQYPGFDPELMQWRLEELETNWQLLLEKAATEAGQQDYSCFD